MRTSSFYFEAAAFYLGAAAFVGFFFLVVALAGCQSAPADEAGAGRAAEVKGIDIVRVADGRITGHGGASDFYPRCSSSA